MEKKKFEEFMGSENFTGSDSPMVFSDEFPGGGGIFDDKGCSFDLLFGINDYYNPSLLDLISSAPPPPPLQQPPLSSPASTVPESSEVLNAPPTPNSSSVSSFSGEEIGKGISEEAVEEKNGEKVASKLLLKGKKKNQKRQREPRFAFMTKSDIDNLDDGYRWRKYGQKAVKNSPYPRSYYRCTTAGCGVKKRVERSSGDHSIVVTTYEGQHTHQSPVMPRRVMSESNSCLVADHNSTATATTTTTGHLFHQPFVYSPPPFVTVNSSSMSPHPPPPFPSPPSRASVLRDQGLLQDVVPLQMRKEPKDEQNG